MTVAAIALVGQAPPYLADRYADTRTPPRNRSAVGWGLPHQIAYPAVAVSLGGRSLKVNSAPTNITAQTIPKAAV